MTIINYNSGPFSHSNSGSVNVYNENNNSFNLFLLKQFIALYDERNKRIEQLINEFKNESLMEKKQLLLGEIKSCHKENEQIVHQMKQQDNDNKDKG
jgi:hypothetical protein